jgi:tetratricopeptide (TPR) repeat protein/spermidine synthase
MSKNKGFLSILIPGATVFFSSACIMVLELVASRLIARHLGSSLYTWTSVIGIVLAGITVGNYLGGRIADSFPARKALAIILCISSATCVITVVSNNLVGDWIWLWKLSWPVRVFTHVFLVFMLPSTLLGMISPVVAKMALDVGLPTGRTVGDIYAFGAAGSIVGTFVTGFYLIAMMGTVAIIWSIGAALLLMAILYWYRLWVLYLWAVIFVALMTMGMAPLKWTEGATPSSFALGTAWSLALRERPDPAIIYEDESQYCHIIITSVSDIVDKRTFTEDKLIHSMIIMDNILNLQYPYEQIYAAVTHIASRDKSKLSVFAIGGGGYVFPRYVEKVWPGSQIDVAEIDPRVTEAAIQGFGLDRNTSINTITMDARNYVDELLNKQRNSEGIHRYDFIYEDAISDYSVPYQLTTTEFNNKIAQLLADDGVYMINLIDTYNIGLFVGAVVNTLEKTFSNIYIISEERTRRTPWGTFVIVAAMREINLDNLALEKPVAKLNLWILNNSEIETLKEKGRGVVLTDDYAPVENMLAPVVRQSAIGSLPNKYLERAVKLENQGKLDESLEMYKKVIKLNPTMAISAYNSMGQILASQEKWQEAIDAAQNAIEYNEKASGKHSMADMYFNIALASEKLSRNKDASEYLHKAIEAYQKDLAQEPNIVKTLRNLGSALVKVGQAGKATEYLQRAVNAGPREIRNHLMLADALSEQQRYDEATEVLRKAIVFFSNARNEKAVIELQRHLWFIEDRKNSNKK